jgi:hypothetical protein
MLLTLAAIFAAMVVAAEPTGSAAGSPGAVAGTVTLTDASGGRFDAPGVRLTLTCAATPDAARVATSDDHGTFRFRDVRPDRCSIDTDLQGFAKATALAVVRAGDTVEVAIHLDIAPVRTGITVVGEHVSSWRTKRFN